MTETNPNSVVSNVSKEMDRSANDALPVSGERKKLMKLEAIRGFAAFYVLCYHTLPKYTTIFGHDVALFRFAQEAVMLFFILSGFVIQYAYLTSSDKSFRSFFLKRFLRIFIPLVCVFIAHYLLLSASNMEIANADIYSLAGNLLMLQQVPEMWFQPAWFEPYLKNMPLWTLSFEWWFYMIFFAISHYFGKSAPKVVYILSTVAAITYIFFPFSINRELMYLIIWWMGADMARLYVNKQKINLYSMKLPLMVLVSVAALCIGHFFYYQHTHPDHPVTFVTTPLIEIRHFWFSLAAIVIAAIWQKINWFGFRYTLGLFQVLAPISFCLYISHWYFVSIAHYLDNVISHFYIRALIYFTVCCLFCYLVERVIYPKLSKKILAYFSVKKKPLVAIN